MNEFLTELRTQRWDDHRYYHHSRINQTLHLVSALSFLVAYVMLFINPAVAALIGWLVSMTTRQAGHFFFEPQGLRRREPGDPRVQGAIKVGYNLRRKVVLIAIWALSPFALLLRPHAVRAVRAGARPPELVDQVGLIWLAIGVGGLLFRTVQLFFIRDVQTGLVWMTKILTDPFHDIRLYYRAPLYLLRGELIDPMHHAMQHKRRLTHRLWFRARSAGSPRDASTRSSLPRQTEPMSQHLAQDAAPDRLFGRARRFATTSRRAPSPRRRRRSGRRRPRSRPRRSSG